MENELREIEEKEIITEEDIDESDPENNENNENKKYDESRIYYVYEHIRLDKMEPFYIGKGKGERAYDLYRNDHHDAITDKYGHAVVIIADKLTEEEAYWLERDTIEDYVFNLGYGINIEGHEEYDHELPHLTNMDWGGIGGKSGVSPYANKTPEEMEETRIKMSESHKGIMAGEKNPMFGKNPEDFMTEQAIKEKRRKQSESLKGEKHPLYGKHHSDETKEKMSESHKGIMAGEKSAMWGKPAHNRRKVICITTGKIFNSVTDASDYYNVAISSISLCCKGILYKSAGKLNGIKLQWKYLDDDNESKAV